MNEEIINDKEETVLSKDELNEIERKQILKNVLSGNIYSLRDKVAYVLNNYPEARNSDIDLSWTYWSIFEGNIFKGGISNKEQLYNLTKINSLTRARAKIQNEYKLFQADDIVKKHRGKLEVEKKEAAIIDKPKNLPSYNIYIDESGKNDNFLIIGSIWVTDNISDPYRTNIDIKNWKSFKNIKYEFHFAEMRKGELEHYKEYFMKFLSLNPTISFKAIVINNSGFNDKSLTLESLTFHLINKGILHENETGRAILPRNLSVVIDSEELGSDKLKAENLKERINAQNIDGLVCRNIEALDSLGNNYLQIADLFVASINRKLNNNTNTQNHKDELSNYILGLVNFDIGKLNKLNNDIDKSTVFNLTYNNTNN